VACFGAHQHSVLGEYEVEYTSSFVRYERRGNRVVPVRVTKSWVSAEGLRGQLKARSFHATRVTELKMRDVRGGREEAPEAWSSWPERVESRARLLAMPVKYKLAEGGEPVLVPEGAGLPTLAIGDLTGLTWAQANQPMDAEPESREWWIRLQWAESRGWDDELEAA
jgi:hypothetical protein